MITKIDLTLPQLINNIVALTPYINHYTEHTNVDIRTGITEDNYLQNATVYINNANTIIIQGTDIGNDNDVFIKVEINTQTMVTTILNAVTINIDLITLHFADSAVVMAVQALIQGN